MAVSNDKFFRIKFEGSNGLMSLNEKRKLSPGEYHLIESTSTNEYEVLQEVERTVGNRIFSKNLFPEPYRTYIFERVKYQVINDFEKDGFEYDHEREVVFYGWLYGVYATYDGNYYYDVITGKKIAWEVIGSQYEMITVDDYLSMIEDLRIIEKHKDVYERVTEEIFAKLTQGAINQHLAAERYKKNYEAARRAQKKELQQSIEKHKQIEEQQRNESKTKKEEAKRLICKIRNIPQE